MISLNVTPCGIDGFGGAFFEHRSRHAGIPCVIGHVVLTAAVGIGNILRPLVVGLDGRDGTDIVVAGIEHEQHTVFVASVHFLPPQFPLIIRFSERNASLVSAFGL